MTPEQLAAAMSALDVSERELARLLRLGPNGRVAVYRWLSGKHPISGPVSVAIEAMLSGWRPE